MRIYRFALFVMLALASPAVASAQDKSVIDTTLSPQPLVGLHNNGDGSFSRKNYLITAGSTGFDWSVNKPAPPNIGANFGGTGPYANYVLVQTVSANVSRNAIDCENDTGAQIVIERDDGTAANGAAPINATIFALAGGAAAAQQGGGWSSTTFRGRIQVFAPQALTSGAYLACMED
jgi:hypothetical protein